MTIDFGETNTKIIIVLPKIGMVKEKVLPETPTYSVYKKGSNLIVSNLWKCLFFTNSPWAYSQLRTVNLHPPLMTWSSGVYNNVLLLSRNANESAHMQRTIKKESVISNLLESRSALHMSERFVLGGQSHPVYERGNSLWHVDPWLLMNFYDKPNKFPFFINTVKPCPLNEQIILGK